MISEAAAATTEDQNEIWVQIPEMASNAAPIGAKGGTRPMRLRIPQVVPM